ncbi:MAG: DciA family protein [Elusimicrobiales bacterium]
MSSCRSGKGWSPLAVCADRFKNLPIKLSRMMLLGSVWGKEAGAMAAHWELYGADAARKVIFVKVSSAAARQELSLRAPALIRSLNKYFDRPWIAEIRLASRGEAACKAQRPEQAPTDKRTRR